MNNRKNKSNHYSPGINSLEKLPFIRASEFFNSNDIEDQTQQNPHKTDTKLFANDREYRFCRAIVENPLQPSSVYPKQAGISAKSAKSFREDLIAKGYIREQILDSGGRGRSTILLEMLSAGIRAVNHYRPQKGS